MAVASRAQMRRTVRRETEGLRRLPNVTHVTLGEKVVQGLGVGRLAIKVYVRVKEQVENASGLIPSFFDVLDTSGACIDRIETDVVESGDLPTVFGLRSGDVLRAFDNDLGIAALSFVKGANAYAITNAHVACDVARGGASGRMAWQDGETLIPLGPVISWTRLDPNIPATADAAVIRLDNPAIADSLGITGIKNPISHMDIIRMSANYWFMANGERFECSKAEPADGDNGAAVVDEIIINYRGFWQLTMTKGKARKGLSGSLLCRTVNGVHVACGLIFGGVVPEYIWAYPFKPLYKKIYNNLPS